MDRNQNAEELFLRSIVAYNASFATLQRARGTFLRTESVGIKRVLDTDATHPAAELERLGLSQGSPGKEAAGPASKEDRRGLFHRSADSPSPSPRSLNSEGSPREAGQAE